MPILQRLDKVASGTRKNRQLDVLLTVTAPRERLYFAIAVVLAMAMGIWVMLHEFEQTMTIEGVLIKPGERFELLPNQSGVLIEYYVSPGHQVIAGDSIAHQSLPELNRELSLLQRYLNALEQEGSQAQSDPASVAKLQAIAQTELLELQARHAAQEIIVAPIAGEVMELPLAAGSFISREDSIALIRNRLDEGPEAVQAVLRVAPNIARRMRQGMPVTIEVIIPDAHTARLSGEVVSVTAGPLPRWLSGLQPATERALSRIDIALYDLEHPVADGTRCRVQVVLGKSTPAELLASSLWNSS